MIPAADRSQSGYRVYGARDVHTLRFIHRARALGFSVKDIRQLLSLWQDRTWASAEVKALALAHLSELDEKLSKLEAVRRTLGYLVAHCEGNHRPDCPILDDLAGNEGSELSDRRGGLRFN